MSTDPGVDELLARYHLRDLGVGHTPPDPEDDWWTALYPDDDPDPGPDDPQTGADDPDEPPDPSGWFRKVGGRLPDWRKGEAPDLGGPAPDDAEDDPDDEPEWEEAEPDDESTPQAVRRSKRAPGRRAQEAYVGLPHRTRVLVYNGSAAGAGWLLGLESLFAGWISDCEHDTGSVGTAVIVGLGVVTAIGVLIDRRTRHWWPPLAWCCRIPLASALLALALYTSN